eukprot:Blabericola_migrator_1__2915@NODE_1839_length_3700_cov_36_800440_g1177_i0_p1_GENE_NODE_1839_length_3700_cov_36_800440_g1177_i0NODE_1839_length_3700_cov_36_800440_g1177_i0_p1_ORF_typecomplete_len688_score75_09Ezh2_MCSS/PF18600_1/0_12HTH_18/PF12833_7/6_9e02HTH_18/PF12833_7/1_8DUF4248/PF14053_6/0_81DUF4248/PF14053_6/3_5e03_NODE_1839_length_3700_cov_36_800440_g1177_i015273590
MPPTRYLCLSAHKSNSSSLRQSLTLGLTCLVSIGGGHQTVLSLPAENKRPADDSQRDVDVHQSKRPFRDSSPTNLPGTSHSQPESCEVDPSQWVELLSMGWTLDDAELIARESEISADTQKLWRAFRELVHELTFPEPCHEGVHANFNEFSKHVKRFFGNPRSYLEDRIFFSMAEPLMSLSQHIEEWEHLTIQRYFRSCRMEALLKWLSSRNESKALIPEVRLHATTMEDITADMKYWGRQDYPQYNEDDPIEACFVRLLHGIEDVDLYEKCIAHIKSTPELEEASLLKLLVIVPYFTKSKVAKDVSSSTALSYLSRWVERNSELTDQDFARRGWTLNNFHFADEISSNRQREDRGEREIEKRFLEIAHLIRKVRGGERDRVLSSLEGKMWQWMSFTEDLLANCKSYRALRIVVGMLPSLAAVRKYLDPDLRRALREFTITQRARALERWLHLANGAKFLVHGRRLRPGIMATLCRSIATHARDAHKGAEKHSLHLILCNLEDYGTAEAERRRVERNIRHVLRLGEIKLAGLIVVQLFHKHSSLTSVLNETLESCLDVLMSHQASSFTDFVRNSGIDKIFESGCIRAAQRAYNEESSNIYDPIIKETVHAYEKSWAVLDPVDNSKVVIDHITKRRNDLCEAELFSALACLVCIKHRCRTGKVERDVAGCIILCEERLRQLQERRSTT